MGYLQTIQYIDECDRCMGVVFVNDERFEGQVDSHGYSYFKARCIMQDLGFIMGLDKKLLEVENDGS